MQQFPKPGGHWNAVVWVHIALQTRAGGGDRNNERRCREQIFLIGIRVFLMAEGKYIET